MRRHLGAVLAGVVVIGGSALVPAASAAAATVRPAINCIQNPTTNGNVKDSFTGQGVNIRTGPSTSCTAVGEGNKTDSVTVRCVTFTNNWLYLKDNTTGKIGWVDPDFVKVVVGGIPQCN